MPIKKIINYIVAAAILCAALPVSAERVGQLFFSPEERKLLDRQRQNPSPVYSATGTTITLNGVVQGSSGKTVIWVNGTPHDQQLTTNVTQSVPIRVPETGQSIQLKPGQTYNTVSGQVSDVHTDIQSGASAKPKAADDKSAKPVDKSQEKTNKK